MDANRDGDASRRHFVRRGLVGLCACGCVGAGTAGVPYGGLLAGQEQEPDDFPRNWIGAMLPALGGSDPDEARRILKASSRSHYDDLTMDETAARFRGNVPAFLGFLRSEWEWVIEYDAEAGLIQVNENKEQCVCPLVRPGAGEDLGVLCYCSEGFAERLFTAVAGVPVQAEVTESILRGGRRCRYRIQLKT